MWGEPPPIVSGAPGRGFGAVFRGLVLTFLRLIRPSRVCGGFVFPFIFAFGLWAYRGFCGSASSVILVSRFVLGFLLRGGFVFAFSYSDVSYSDHSSKLTMFLNCSGMSPDKKIRRRLFTSFK